MSTFDFLLEDDCMKDTSCDDINKGRNNGQRRDRRQPFNNRRGNMRVAPLLDRPNIDDSQTTVRPNMDEYQNRMPDERLIQKVDNSHELKMNDEGHAITFQRRDRPKTVERTVMYNLNKMTIENFHTACESIVTSIIDTMGSQEEMERIAQMIIQKALEERENMETYADLIQVLSWRLYDSEFGDAPLTKAILSILQNYAQEIPPVLQLTEQQMREYSKQEQIEELAKIRERTLAITACLGHFLVLGLIRSKIWKNLMKRLLYAPDDNTAPADHCIEGAVISVLACGYHLDTITDKSDKDLANAKYHLDQTMYRLQHLMSLDGVSTRAKILVNDLLETRDRQWHRKIHTDRPTTMQEIANEHERDCILGGAVIVAQMGKVELVGSRRKDRLPNTDYSIYWGEQEKKYLELRARKSLKE